jgi:outer membrane lipoprotein carrier protein
MKRKPSRQILHAGAVLFALITVSFAYGMSITAKEIIEKVQSKYGKLDNVVLNFTQSVKFRVNKSEQQATGTLYFKKKNKYRIETDQHIIVTDGQTSWSYSPQNKQVIIDKYKEDTHSLSPEHLLVSYPQDFYSSLIGEEKLGAESVYVLKLTPKEDNAFATKLKIWVGKNWIIRKVETTDISGAVTTYTIKDISIDKGISDNKFEFKPPQGVDVIDLR